MDFNVDDNGIDDDDDDIETKHRTLWVGNLHPRVSYENIAELFYQVIKTNVIYCLCGLINSFTNVVSVAMQVGPIEYIEFSFDNSEKCENYALVIFKHACSVEDSLRLFRGTKLYGLPIETKKYSGHLEHPVFHNQLNYLKQLIDVERQIEHSSHSNDSSQSKWNDQSSNNIPDCLPEPPLHNTNSYKNNYDHRSDPVSRHCYKDRSSSRYQHSNAHAENHNPMYKSGHNPTNKSYDNRRHYQKPDKNSSSASIEMPNNDQDSCHNNRNYDRKHRDYNTPTSFNCKESTNRNEELPVINENNSATDVLPVRDLRDTMYCQRSVLDFDYDDAVCTSQLDLRDTMYRNKSNRYENLGQQYESNSKNQWSERNHKSSTCGSSSYPDNQSRKNNYNSERYNKSHTRHQNHYSADQGYYNQSYNKDCSQEYSNEYPNNYNDCYNNREKNRSNSKSNQARPQNMESSGHSHSFYHPYKRNDENYGRKEYKDSYNERSGHNHVRNSSTGTYESRQNYYA